MGKIRTFVGCHLGGDPTRAVAEVGRRLAAALASRGWKVRWVDAEKIHLTLKFLGNVPEERIAEIREAVAPVGAARPPLVARVGGIGVFPPRGVPRVVWVGIEDAGGSTAALAGDVDARLAAIGFEREERRFHPHVTLGRVKSAGGGRIPDVATEAGLGEADCGEARLDSVTLFRSDLATGKYHVLERIPLVGEAGAAASALPALPTTTGKKERDK